MPKSNIKVSRYQDSELPLEARCADGTFPWEASIEPEDGAWCLFVPKDKSQEPRLFIHIGETTLEDGTIEQGYAESGSPEHEAYLEALARREAS